MSTTLNPSTTPLASENGEAKAPAGIDPRGPQFAASLTAVVLVAVLLLDQLVLRRVPALAGWFDTARA